MKWLAAIVAATSAVALAACGGSSGGGSPGGSHAAGTGASPSPLASPSPSASSHSLDFVVVDSGVKITFTGLGYFTNPIPVAGSPEYWPCYYTARSGTQCTSTGGEFVAVGFSVDNISAGQNWSGSNITDELQAGGLWYQSYGLGRDTISQPCVNVDCYWNSEGTISPGATSTSGDLFAVPNGAPVTAIWISSSGFASGHLIYFDGKPGVTARQPKALPY